MIVICEACGVRYRIDSSRFSRKSVLGKCRACGHLFKITLPEPRSESEGPNPTSPPFPGKNPPDTHRAERPPISRSEPYPERTFGISEKIFLWISLAGLLPILLVWLVSGAQAQSESFPRDILLILAVLVFFVLAALISRIIARPIKTLAKSAYRMSLGEMDIEMSEKYKDEIGDLADSFIRMRESVRILIERAKRKKEETPIP